MLLSPGKLTICGYHQILRRIIDGAQHIIGERPGRQRNADEHDASERKEKGVDIGPQGNLQLCFHSSFEFGYKLHRV